MEVETLSYDDRGIVTAETIITLPTTELVIVEDKMRDEHRVYERDVGDVEPHTRLDK